MKWEQREKWAQCIETPEVPYTPQLGEPNPDNPLCFFEVRSGGYYLGRVVFELKADTHPITAENFLKLCEYHCYAGTMFKVFPGNWIRGGDFTELDDIVYDANDPDFFDFASLLPDAAPGGQSIYVTESGPYFDDENVDAYSHDGPGVLTMYNPGAPNCNGSQFMITFSRVEPEVLDSSHVAFGQVVEGWNVLAALEQLGDARQGGSDIPADHRGAVRGGEAREERDGGRRGGRRGGVHVRGGVRVRVGEAPGARREGVTSGGKKTPLQSGKVRGGSRARREVRVRVSSTRAR